MRIVKSIVFLREAPTVYFWQKLEFGKLVALMPERLSLFEVMNETLLVNYK